MASAMVEDPSAVREFLPVLLSPRPDDLNDPSYWWALACAARYVSDTSPIAKVYLRFAPNRSVAFPAYFSSLAVVLPRLRWKDILLLCEWFRDRPAFWYFFSDYLTRRADRCAYKILLENLDNPALQPYLWNAVARYVLRDGYRAPELLVALSNRAGDFHYWRVLKRYLRRRPELAPYILFQIPVRNRYFVLTALYLAKRFPRQLYPVVQNLVRSGER